MMILLMMVLFVVVGKLDVDGGVFGSLTLMSGVEMLGEIAILSANMV